MNASTANGIKRLSLGASACLISIVFGAGCATTDDVVKAGQLPESGQKELAAQKFRGRWWSYYQRGAILMRYQRYAEAEADFRVAMGKRSEDSRWARTYGLHFLPEYFPNRELGVVLYEQGDFVGAESYLQRSYDQAQSARGAYYLNRVRERRVLDGGVDHEPPSIETPDLSKAPVGDVVYPIRIRVTDDTFVQSVSINGTPIRTVSVNGEQRPFELWPHSLEVGHSLALAAGRNTIEISATDIAGKETTRSFEVIADHDGPAIHYEITAGAAELRGQIADETGIEQLVIDGQPVSLIASTNRSAVFSYPVDSGRLNAGVEYVAKDVLGNETRGTISGALLSQIGRASCRERV